MRKDKVKAFELRRQEKSYSEISRVLKVSKSTLAGWFKKEEWSQDIRNKLGTAASLAFPKKLDAVLKANKKRWAGIHESYRKQAESEFASFKKDPLFIAGVMLYWGEGEKTAKHPSLKLANSDPQMIRVFYSFLKDCLHVPEEKIKAYLLLYPDLQDSMQKTFWSRATGIPLNRFWNSIYITGKHPARRLSYGVCNINVNSRELKERILMWIQLFQKELA